jgi:hypothetical protein
MPLTTGISIYLKPFLAGNFAANRLFLRKILKVFFQIVEQKMEKNLFT